VQLSNLDDDDDEVIADEDAPLADISVPIISFDEIAQELMDDSQNENEDLDDTDEAHDDEQMIGSDDDRLLQNLFDYPSLSDPNSQTFSFMTEFWQRREVNLRAETILHENITTDLSLDTETALSDDFDEDE
jgi:hypothetical protein